MQCCSDGRRYDAKTMLALIVFVISGIFQPLLMTLCKSAGLAASSAQLYMLFYYAGPSCLLVTVLPCCENNRIPTPQPSVSVMMKATLIACFDIAAQTLNFTGASLAGATLFAVVYSSVTVWTALFSRCFYERKLSSMQCCAIALVVLGLCMAAFDSISVGGNVVRGTMYVLVGSCMHGGTYVMSEAVMAKSRRSPSIGFATCDIDETMSSRQSTRDLLSVSENSAIQSVAAFVALLCWQIVYTIPRWDDLVRHPVERAGTSTLKSVIILLSFGMANLFHSYAFFYTLAYYPGGSTSAGVMKGLQAVLVFVAAHVFFCSSENSDSCFSTQKFASLTTVVVGVVLYSVSSGERALCQTYGYTRIDNAKASKDYGDLT